MLPRPRPSPPPEHARFGKSKSDPLPCPRAPRCFQNDPNGPVFDPVHGVIHHFYQIHLATGKGGGPDYGHVSDSALGGAPDEISPSIKHPCWASSRANPIYHHAHHAHPRARSL